MGGAADRGIDCRAGDPVLPAALTCSSLASAVTILVIGLAVFIGLVAVQVRSIIRSPFPGLQGLDA
jgi:hypothetical protein